MTKMALIILFVGQAHEQNEANRFLIVNWCWSSVFIFK